MKQKIEQAKQLVNQKLEGHKKRLKHVYGVAQTAVQLAKHYDVNEDELELAGLMHDYAKFDDLEEQQKGLDEQTIQKYASHPVIFHALAAANAIEDKLDVHQETILSAVRNHVWGKPKMTVSDKILFVADFCEPNRTFEDKTYIYELAIKNLDQAVLYCMETSIQDLKRQGKTPSPQSLEAYQYYKEETRGIIRNDN